jgi:hypothetical protein
MLLILFVWIIFILADAFVNFYQIEKVKTVPNYYQSTIIRGMASILHGILANSQSLDDFKWLFLFQITSFWLIFDLTLNKLRKKPLFYVGSNSLIDRFFRKKPVWILVFAKVVAVFVAILSFIKYGIASGKL